MFHDASDIDIGSIAKRININLDSMVKKRSISTGLSPDTITASRI
jgi:hypothetical protein